MLIIVPKTLKVRWYRLGRALKVRRARSLRTAASTIPACTTQNRRLDLQRAKARAASIRISHLRRWTGPVAWVICQITPMSRRIITCRMRIRGRLSGGRSLSKFRMCAISRKTPASSNWTSRGATRNKVGRSAQLSRSTTSKCLSDHSLSSLRVTNSKSVTQRF